jgi:hypothetical protein
MQHVIIEQPAAGRALPLPHFLKMPKWNNTDYYTAIIESNRSIESGDEIGWMQNDEFKKTGTVKSIIERRKAKGDWSKNTYDKAPDFINFDVL